MSDDIKKRFALWARARGHKRPDTIEGMKVLFAQFVAQEFQPPTWDEIRDPNQPVLVDNGATVEIEDAHAEDDDFHQEIAERERILHEEAGGDDFTRDAILGDRAQAELSKQAAFTRNNPPSAVKGVLGGQGTVTPGGQALTLAYWQGDDAETTPVTVTLGAINQPSLAHLGAGSRSFATIRFGTRGFSLSIEVDVGSGCQFTISGSSVVVSVQAESTAASSENITAMISFSPVVRTTTLTRTKYVVNNAGFTSVAIPPFSRTVKALGGAASNATAVTVKDSQGNSLYSVASDAQGNTPETILSGDASQILVPSSQDMRLVFGLSL